MFCSNCGKKKEKEDNYCSSCGAGVGSVAVNHNSNSVSSLHNMYVQGLSKSTSAIDSSPLTRRVIGNLLLIAGLFATTISLLMAGFNASPLSMMWVLIGLVAIIVGITLIRDDNLKQGKPANSIRKTVTITVVILVAAAILAIQFSAGWWI